MFLRYFYIKQASFGIAVRLTYKQPFGTFVKVKYEIC